LNEAPFHDIYDIIEFALPARPVKCRDIELKSKLQVPLRLARSSGTEPAELWTLRDHAVEQLDAFVRSAHDRVLGRLRFAVTGDEPPTIVLMAVRGKTAPPALDFQGQSYRRHQRMDNLFVPIGKRIEPPLRRDAVRKLLADDPELITWLVPGDEEGAFTPESIPDRAFESLDKWIDYVIERDKSALATWVRSARFDFQPFICKDEIEPRRKQDKTKRRGGDDLDEDEAAELPVPTEPKIEVISKSKKREPRSEETVLLLPREEPGELLIKLGELETRFKEDTTALDDPGRLPQWRELALVNTALGDRHGEACLCWLHFLWEQRERHREGLQGWVEAARSSVQKNAPLIRELNRIAASKDPQDTETHFFAAGVAYAGLSEVPESGKLDVARAREFLEKHEGPGFLPIRAIWLAWLGLSRLAGGDDLALARARDRLLERLYQYGLGPEREVPHFLRFSSHRQSEKFRNVRDRVMRLRDRAQEWIQRFPSYGKTYFGSGEKHRTNGYIDLTFAFGLARLGEKTECEKLLKEGKQLLHNVDDVHLILSEGYEYRIRQALDNKPHAGPLPAHSLEQIKMLRESGTSNSYGVDRLRQYSAILDPDESFDPYRYNKAPIELDAELTPLSDLREPMALTARIDQLLTSKRKDWNTPLARVQIFGAILQVAPRLGQDYCLGLLRAALELLANLETTLEPAYRKDAHFLVYRLAPLLQHAINVSAHFGQVDFAREFVGRFLGSFSSLNETSAIEEIENIVRKCFQALRKLGLRNEIDRMLHGMAGAILLQQTLAQARERLGNRWVPSLCTLLHVAAGWLYAGKIEAAAPILDAARAVLADPDIGERQKDKLSVSCAYLTALGQAPVEMALQRIEQFFTEIGPIFDSLLCNQFYSLSQLKVVEAMVLAVASEDFAIGPDVRRWLDDEEYLVRRRIHADVRGLGHGE
ncbi:MAG: hypothetical protein AB7K24_19760, partial [Gemmataceae bacterium]